MARFEQYEIWEFNHGRWEMAASFPDFELAKELVRQRHGRVRLLRVVYDDAKRINEEVLSEIGTTREKP